jgi:hypothetical protein
MNLKIQTIVPAVLLFAATSVFAAPLTAQQCANAAMNQPAGQLTRAQVEQHLSDLEAVGYIPGSNDAYYPRAIQSAERKVSAEYQSECGSRS